MRENPQRSHPLYVVELTTLFTWMYTRLARNNPAENSRNSTHNTPFTFDVSCPWLRVSHLDLKRTEWRIYKNSSNVAKALCKHPLCVSKVTPMAKHRICRGGPVERCYTFLIHSRDVTLIIFTRHTHLINSRGGPGLPDRLPPMCVLQEFKQSYCGKTKMGDKFRK